METGPYQLHIFNLDFGLHHALHPFLVVSSSVMLAQNVELLNKRGQLPHYLHFDRSV